MKRANAILLLWFVAGCGAQLQPAPLAPWDVEPVIPSDVPTRIIETEVVQPSASEPEPEPKVKKEKPEPLPFPTLEEIEEGIYYGELLYV